MLKYIRQDNKSYTNKTLRKLNYLLLEGDRILADEFKNIIKHYSSQSSVVNFMTFLINESDVNPESDDEKLYLPNETINKLEDICTWFLKKEQNSELYNQNMEHCDVNEKLNYTEIRFEFLKFLTSYLKMDTTDLNATKTKTLTKLFHSSNASVNSACTGIGSSTGGSNTPEASGSKHRFISSGFKHLRKRVNDIQSNFAPKNPISDRQNFSNNNPKNLNSLAQEESNQNLVNKRLNMNGPKMKAFEYIEGFCDNLNFCLRILKHEKLIITRIFKNSEETKHELLCKLTILIIDQIQSEFELFLTNGVDFKQIQNNGHQVVNSIIELVIKIDKLKENTNDLQIFDIPCAAKLIHFSTSLREITSQILFVYVDAVKCGFSNTFLVPPDCSVHAYCQETCQIIRLVRTNEDNLDEVIKMVCENHIDKQAGESQNQDLDEEMPKYAGE
jgi:hypothetical protein